MLRKSTLFGVLFLIVAKKVFISPCFYGIFQNVMQIALGILTIEKPLFGIYIVGVNMFFSTQTDDCQIPSKDVDRAAFGRFMVNFMVAFSGAILAILLSVV